jgi:hypothetical protein
MTAVAWNSAVNGSWSNPSDWSTQSVPGAGDDVTVGVAGSYTVAIDGAQAAGSLTLSDGGATVTDSGSLEIGKAITITAGTFNLEGVIEGGMVRVAGGVFNAEGGTITGATLSATGGGFQFQNGTLDGVTVDGPLDLGPGAVVWVTANGLTTRGAGGVGNGVINLNGGHSYILYRGSQTIDRATIHLGSYATLQTDNVNDGSPTLVLGPDLTIDQTRPNTYSQILPDVWSNTSLSMVNEGTINAASSGGTLSIGGIFAPQLLTLTNEGTIVVSHGDRVSFVDGVDLTNLAGQVLTGGWFEVDAGSTLQLVSGATVATDDATIILSGARSTLKGSAPLESTLTAIGTSGTLEILGGRGWTSGLAMSNGGVLDLGGGVFSSGGLTDTAGSSLRGFGNITSPFTDSGQVIVTAGKTLALTGASTFEAGGLVNGAGTLAITDATLAGLTVGEKAKVVDVGEIDQTGNILLRRFPSSPRLTIEVGAVWRLDGDVGMARRGSLGPVITVDGTLIKSAGSGVSAVGVTVTDKGAVEAAVGTLDFMAGVTGAGAMTIDAGATLEFNKAAANTLTATFAGAGATLALSQASTFAATIAGFTAGQTLDLLGTAADSAVLGSGDQLVITNGSTAVATLQLTGDYTGDTFTTTSDGKGGTSITVSTGGAVAPPAVGPVPTPHAFIAAAAAFGATGGAAHATAVAHDAVWRTILSAPRAMAA